MIWLLRLYPRRWRQRYGEEVSEMLSRTPFTLATAVDLIAGAIDVRLHPAATMRAAAAASQIKVEDDMMMTKILRFDCGAGFTSADQWKSAGVMLGGTVVLTVAWMWLHVRLGDNPYVDTLSVMPFLVPIVFSMRFTYLKGRPASVQLTFMVGVILLVAVTMLTLTWLLS